MSPIGLQTLSGLPRLSSRQKPGTPLDVADSTTLWMEQGTTTCMESGICVHQLGAPGSNYETPFWQTAQSILVPLSPDYLSPVDAVRAS